MVLCFVSVLHVWTGKLQVCHCCLKVYYTLSNADLSCKASSGLSKLFATLSNSDDQVFCASSSCHSVNAVMATTIVAYHFTLIIVEATDRVLLWSTIAFHPSAACLLPQLDGHFLIIERRMWSSYCTLVDPLDHFYSRSHAWYSSVNVVEHLLLPWTTTGKHLSCVSHVKATRHVVEAERVEFHRFSLVLLSVYSN